MNLTTPVLDKFGYDTTILPRDTLVIARQVGQPSLRQHAPATLLDQLELPSGEVMDLRATVGEEDGSTGLKGKVNNHYGKLLLAHRVSAILNIGVRSAVGTPGPIEFFRNPLQDAAQDVGQGVQQEAQQLSIGSCACRPTISRKRDTFCTIHLLENHAIFNARRWWRASEELWHRLPISHLCTFSTVAARWGPSPSRRVPPRSAPGASRA